MDAQLVPFALEILQLLEDAFALLPMQCWSTEFAFLNALHILLITPILKDANALRDTFKIQIPTN
jgi:hypothetical protein